jgi:DNA-binding beta-propeller fold protein YncE
MKYQTLYKRILGVGLMLALLTGCTAPAIPAPTPMPPTSSPTVEVTLSPTVPARSTLSPMEKIWGMNGAPNSFHRPTELALDDQGNIYIIDGGNHRVQKFDKDGNFILMWGGPGAGEGQFLFQAPPAHYGSITVDKDGYVYVTDHHNRVQKFDSNGNFLMKFGDTGYIDGKFYTLYGIAVDDHGNIYTTDLTKYEVQKFDQDGNFLQKWEVPSCQPGGISSPHNLVVDGQGQIYISNADGNCIQKFDNEGNLLQHWGEMGEADGQFQKPIGLALDAQENIYVSENRNNRIQKFDPNGNFLAIYGPFDYPVGITVDHEGHVYVIEIVFGVLQKLRLQ